MLESYSVIVLVSKSKLNELQLELEFISVNHFTNLNNAITLLEIKA